VAFSGRRHRVDVEIRGKDNLSPATAKSEKGLRSFGDTAASVKAGLFAFTAAVAAMTVALASSLAEFAKNEVAATKYAAALRSADQFSQANVESAKALSKELQDQANIARADGLEMASLALAFTKNAEEAERLTRAAADFASGAGLNMEEALRRLGRATQGSVDDVSKFVPEIRNLTKAQLEAGEATRLISERFEGQAKAATDNLAGAYKSLTLAVSDSTAAFGEGAATAGNFQTEIEELATTVAESEGTMTLLGTAVGTVAGVFPAAIRRMLQFAENARLAAAGTNALSEATDKEAVAATEAAAAVNVLSAAEERRLRIQTDVDDTQKSLNDRLTALGVVLEADVNVQLQANADLMEAVTRNARELGLSEQDLTNIGKALAAEDIKLAETLTGVKEEADLATVAIDALATQAIRADTSAAGLSSSLVGVKAELASAEIAAIRTAQAFDRLAAAQGRAAAVDAAVRSGGQLVLGGTRVNLPGGGSRLTSEPGFRTRFSGGSSGGGGSF